MTSLRLIASDPADPFLDRFFGDILRLHNFSPFVLTPPGVEAAVRCKNDCAILFLLNHNTHPVKVDLGMWVFRDLLNGETVKNHITLDGYGVQILIELAVQGKPG